MFLYLTEAKGAGKMEEGDGIHFPRRPMSKTDAVKYVSVHTLWKSMSS